MSHIPVIDLTGDDDAASTIVSPTTPPSDGRCFWWKLPRELRDTVLTMAYHRENPIKIVPKSTFECRQAQAIRDARLQDRTHIRTTFVPYINRFLISRQFAPEAHVAFLSSTHFDFAVYDPISSLSPSLVAAFREVTAATITLSDLKRSPDDYATQLPQLKRLHIIARRYNFESLVEPTVDLMLDSVTAESFREMSGYGDFAEIRGLREVSFEPLRHESFVKAAEKYKSRFRENVEVIKAALVESLLRPKVEIATPVDNADSSGGGRATAAERDRKRLYDLAYSPDTIEAEILGLATGSQQPAITDDSIPTSKRAMYELMLENPEGLAEWMLSASKRLKTEN